MAKIVYGISGCGSGHSSRAREIMSHLQEQGHQIFGVSYDRGAGLTYCSNSKPGQQNADSHQES